jgi:hypothetical protein
MTDPIDMEVFEDTVHEWFSTATGLTTIWRDQSKVQPQRPFASLKIIAGPSPLSPDWEIRSNYDAGRPAGQEIELTTCVPSRLTVSCQVMSGSQNPTNNARFYMLKALGSLTKESTLALFRAQQIGIERNEDVQDIPELVGGEFDSRSGMDVVFGAPLNETEYNTYIEKVQIKSTALGIDETIVEP